MTAKVKITLVDPGFLAGVRGIDFLLDGEQMALMQFGESKDFEITPGEHTVQVILHGVIKRSSKVLKFSLAKGQGANVESKYSRLWGTMSIKLT